MPRQRAGAGAAAPPPPPSRRHAQGATRSKTPRSSSQRFVRCARRRCSRTSKGSITRIFVKSGQRVSVGTPLVQINPAKQQAAVSSTEANRAGSEADVEYWRQQVKRLASLVEAGAVSKAEYDQAETTLRTAESRLTALDAQVRAGPRRAAVLSRDRAAGGSRRRHSGARGRPRHDLDGDHDHRRRRGARGLHPGAARSRAASCAPGCRCRFSTPTARSSRRIR